MLGKATGPKALRRAECEARILELIATEPMGNVDLEAHMDICRSAIARYTKQMHADRRIHIAVYLYPATGHARPRFAPGDKPDAVLYIKEIRGAPQGDRKAQRIAAVLECLKKPSTVRQIMAAVLLSKASVNHYLALLREDGNKRVRISSWIQHKRRGQQTPVYAIGKGPDVPMPKSQTRAARYKAERRKSKDSAVVSEKIARAQVNALIASARAKPHNIFAALGL